MAQRSISKIAFAFLILVSIFVTASLPVTAQGLSAGTVSGVVVDPNGAVVPNASVTMGNSVTGYTRTVNTDKDGAFRFDNVPLNNYQVSVSATGFAADRETVVVRTSVPITLKIPLAISSATETVTVTSNAADALENV